VQLAQSCYFTNTPCSYAVLTLTSKGATREGAKEAEAPPLAKSKLETR